ncbi:hypothetical protein D9M72_452360 [compost metagenome]
MLDVVPGSQPAPLAQVVDVHFAGVAGHGLGETEHVRPPGPQVQVPEPQVGGELRVVPGVPAHVVAPDVPVGVVGMHHVAVVPEPVPAALLHLAGVEVEQEVQLVLQSGPLRRAAVHGRPVTEHAGRVQVLRGGLQERWRGGGLRISGEGSGVRSGVVGEQRQFVGAGNAGGVAESRFVVLVGDLQPFELFLERVLPQSVVVEPQIHGLRLG